MSRKINILMYSVLGFVLFFYLLYLCFALYLAWPLSQFEIVKAAALGESFGVLGTLFSGLAFWGLIWTILLQRDEIRRQRIESKRERISNILMDEANRCLSDMNQLNFIVTASIIFPMNKPLRQWQFFYNIRRLLEATADKRITYEIFFNELSTIVKDNIEQLTLFYKRVNQSCDMARYLLADIEVPIKELNEIKLLFFSRFDDDIFVLSGHVADILEKLLDKITDKKDILFNPFHSLVTKIKSINSFEKQEVNKEFIRSWKLITSK